jgi:hypothetical protein
MTVLIFIPDAHGQDFICGTTSDEEESFQKALVPSPSVASCPFSTNRGLYLPSTDTLRARVVFVKFQDDTNSVAIWPKNGFPTIALSIIDSSASIGSTHRYSLTNYYRTFSQDQFIVIGKVDTVTLSLPMSLSNFTSNGYETNTYNGNKATLQQLASRSGFQLFDDWTKATHNHCKQSDYKADLIVMIWRSNKFDSSKRIGGFAGLGGSGNTTFEINGIDVIPSFWTGQSSGVSLILGSGFDTEESLFRTVIHEIGHQLLGAGHPFTQGGSDNDKGLHKFPSMMTAGKLRMFMPNPLEGEYLGWADVDDIVANGAYELQDFINSGHAYRRSNTEDNDYYYFFYLNNINIYNDLALNSDDTGIFIMNHRYKPIVTSSGLWNSYLRADNDAFYNKLISSEGDYTWEPSNPFYTTQGHVLFHRVTPNRVTGKSHFTAVPKTNNCETNAFDWMSAIGDHSRAGTPSTNPVHANCHYTNEDYAYADTSYNYLGAGFISSFSYENNRAYFSSITNPAAKRYLHVDSTSFHPLDFAIQVRPVSGSSITFDFELDHDPYLITTDRVWSGEIFIPDSVNVVVMDGATLTILPDTRIFIGRNNARITTWSGGRILAIGTQNKPITFTTSYDTGSWNPSNEWGQLFLSSGGNRFEWCVFEYGTKHIEIASRDNEIRNSIFRNGWRGISSYSNQSGSGPSSSQVLMDQVLLTGNRTVGFVGYHSDSKVSNTTVTHNGEAGTWYMYADGQSFHKSRVDSNAVSSSTRSGVEANTGSVVHLLRYNSGSYLQGDNTIRAQPTYQVLRANGSTLHMGNYYTFGEPGWSNIHGGSSYLVRNLGSGTVTAHENYWGSSDPTASDFEGSFDYDFYYSSAVSVFGASSLPVESHYYRDQYLKGRPGAGDAADEDKARTGRALMATRAAELRGRLTGADHIDPDELETFLGLTASMWDEAWHGADRQANAAVLEDLFRRAMSDEEPSWLVDGVLALVLRERVLTDPGLARRTALDILAAHDAPGVRLTATQALMALDEQQGDLAASRAGLDAAAALMVEVGYRPADIEAFRSMWVGQLASRPEAAFLRQPSDRESPRGPSVASTAAAPSVTVHPNPFNPETVVAVDLRADGPLRVDVYDMLGRRVRTLADGPATAGRHSLRLDGTRLASGVYLVRVSASGHTLTHRITLVK